jgi:phosphatidylinositol alpha-1,6-mannosyltransferase
MQLPPTDEGGRGGILLVCQWPSDVIGGIETMLRELTLELTRTERIVVWPMYPTLLATFHSTHDRLSVLPRRVLSVWSAARLAKIARTHRFEVVVAGHLDCLPAAIIAARVSRCPLVLQTYGWEVARRRRTPAIRWLAGNATTVLAISHLTKDYVRENLMVPADKISVIAPGFRLDGKPTTPARQRRGHTLLTVSRLGATTAHKGHDMVIRALPSLRSTVPDIKYRIVGEGPLRAQLETLAAQLGVSDQVEFAGALDPAELMDAYRNADVFIMPVRRQGESFEGFGIVYLEAMAAGLPCIVGEFSGAAELTRDASVIVDGESVASIADAIVRLFNDDALRDRCQARGLELVSSLEWRDVAPKYLAEWRAARGDPR